MMEKTNIKKEHKGTALVCVLGLVTAWLTMGVMVKGGNSCNRYINQPITPQFYFMMYFVHSAFIIFLLPWLLWLLLQRNIKAVFRAYRWKRNFKASMVFGILTMIVDYAWYRSLPVTSLTANTAIYQSSSAFVLLLSVPLLGRVLEWKGVLCVMTALLGIILTSLDGTASTTEQKDSVVGYVLLLISTFSYALFEVLYKRWDTLEAQMCIQTPTNTEGRSTTGQWTPVPDSDGGMLMEVEDHDGPVTEAVEPSTPLRGNDGIQLQDSAILRLSNACLFTGFMGVTSLVLGASMIPVLFLTKWEPLLPEDKKAWKDLLLLSFFGGLFDVLLMASISLSNPLMVSLGTIMCIPASTLIVWLTTGVVPGVMALAGALFISISFLAIAMITKEE